MVFAIWRRSERRFFAILAPLLPDAALGIVMERPDAGDFAEPPPPPLLLRPPPPPLLPEEVLAVVSKFQLVLLPLSTHP